MKPTVAGRQRGSAGLRASRPGGGRGRLALGAAVLTGALGSGDVTAASDRNTCLVIREALSWTKSSFIQSPSSTLTPCRNICAPTQLFWTGRLFWSERRDAFQRRKENLFEKNLFEGGEKSEGF